MRIAANYLSVKPPFEIQHAERSIPYKASDELLQTILSTLDFLRATLEIPWTLLMLFLVSVLRVVDEILGVGMVFEIGKRVERDYGVREGAREVRGFLEKSAGKNAVRESKKKV